MNILVIAILTSLVAYSTAEQDKEIDISKPKCMQQEFLQRRMRYGNLERKAGRGGKLTFIVEPTEVLHIFFRIHPRRLDIPNYDPYDVPSASSLSLARSLDHLDDGLRNRTTVSVFVNSENKADFFALKNWTESLFQNRSLFTMMYECPSGNTPSYNCMVNTLFRHHREDIVQAEDIVYFVEDDYLHQPDATKQLVDIFSSHNPCFALPYDYADRYYMADFNDDDGKITIIAGKDRNWRTTLSTTVTFSARYATLEYFFILNTVPSPEDDYFASAAMAKSGASIVSPIPSLATHIESYGEYMSRSQEGLDSHEYVSLYYDWFEEAAHLLESAKGMEWNPWKLVEYYHHSKRGGDHSSDVDR